jgi:opacity protein-like surface antigen
MRNIGLIGTILSVLSSESGIAQHKNWNGPYIGLGVGYNFGGGQLSFSEGAPAVSNEQSGNIGFKGPSTEVIAGWGRTFDRYYLGIEASASLYNSQGKITNSGVDGFTGAITTLKTKISKQDAVGLVVRCGYEIFEKVLIYTKIGGISSKFKVRSAHTNTLDSTVNLSRNFNKRLTGFIMGLGTELKFSNRFIARFEASHTQYARKDLINDPINNLKIHFKPQSLEIKAGIIIPLG